MSALKTSFSKSHEFWNDDLSLADTKVFNATLIAGPRNVTDVYLLGRIHGDSPGQPACFRIFLKSIKQAALEASENWTQEVA